MLIGGTSLPQFIWNMFQALRTFFWWVEYFFSLSLNLDSHPILHAIYSTVIGIVNGIFQTDFPITDVVLTISDLLFGGGLMLVLVLTLFNWFVRVILAIVDALT